MHGVHCAQQAAKRIGPSVWAPQSLAVQMFTCDFYETCNYCNILKLCCLDMTLKLPGAYKRCLLLAVQFTAVPQSDGAPLRTVTVRDVISDLPAIENGHDEAEMQYSGLQIFA